MPLPLAATVNVPATLVKLPPKPMLKPCEAGFQVKLPKDWLKPPGALVPVRAPTTEQVDAAFQPAVGIVPTPELGLCK